VIENHLIAATSMPCCNATEASVGRQGRAFHPKRLVSDNISLRFFSRLRPWNRCALRVAWRQIAGTPLIALLGLPGMLCGEAVVSYTRGHTDVVATLMSRKSFDVEHRMSTSALPPSKNG
jgi:hypothetical protein